jgi:hypothetical protein
MIRKHASDKTPINLSDLFFAFCNEYELPVYDETDADEMCLAL